MRPNTWLEVSGLPPARLPDYYGRSLARLARKMVFGTDWPGVPGVQRNATAVQKVLLAAGCSQDDVGLALGGNAASVFQLT
jgi:predicted TIM-barrel fold metal-dependent hydrolase